MAKGEKRSAATLYAGIDIGGTKIHTVIARRDGTILGSARKKTRGASGFGGVMKRVGLCFEEALEEAGVTAGAIRAAGVGVPSAVRADGTAVNAPNLGWRNAPVEASLREILQKPIHAANDCDLGTLGEFVFGAGKGSNTLVGLFFGTGLGGGIVCHGQLIRGENRMAAELGHMVVAVGGRKCGCGHHGCLEAYASKSGMAKRFNLELNRRHRKSLLKPEGGDFAGIRSSSLRDAYRAGDRVTHEVIDEAARYLGIGVANVITMLGPDMIVLGGGVMEALGRDVLKIVRQSAREHTFPPPSFKDTRIVQAQLGDDFVALGGVAYARGLCGD